MTFSITNHNKAAVGESGNHGICWPYLLAALGDY